MIWLGNYLIKTLQRSRHKLTNDLRNICLPPHCCAASPLIQRTCGLTSGTDYPLLVIAVTARCCRILRHARQAEKPPLKDQINRQAEFNKASCHGFSKGIFEFSHEKGPCYLEEPLLFLSSGFTPHLLPACSSYINEPLDTLFHVRCVTVY